jgi:deazaflavin-dependent oxidoreductase (nitroreductase family)
MRGVQGDTQWPARWASEPYLYLTTVGRRTGRPHRIEMWFAAHDGRLYLLAGGRERADWVRNLQADPRVTVELGDETRVGAAHVLEAGTAEDQLARELLLAKYEPTEDDLDEWGRTALPVVIELPLDADESGSCRSGFTGGNSLGLDRNDERSIDIRRSHQSAVRRHDHLTQEQ